ncbi:hypothetical protein PCANC_17756 [Puccinia coronata f. sp. avenae]|uniref:Postreplication repair E3 ubiquitin-protein ligase RAD18 n=1 Tax=Puccinia coronata f. sp. avenae TaxID=200324 RepID=A0A2N5UYS5_9BASI|nr:hypothetical protein PCANC_17756 [Puccinia coronata f. sp. avenae]
MSSKTNKNSLQYQLSLVAPQDFPPELRALSTLDSTLRCPVCKELYQAPVIIHIQKCCHTFCSSCIRTCFNNNSNNHKIGATGLGGVGNSQRCPICKVEAQEEKIKPVPTLESAVICWEDAREEIFKLIARAQASESQLKQIQSTSVNPFSRNTTKNRTPLEDATRKSKENSHAHSKQKAEETRSLPEPKTRAQKKAQLAAPPKRKPQHQSTKGDESDHEIEMLSYNPTDPAAPVRCPVCSTQMLNSKMDEHITACLSGKKKNQAPSSGPAKKIKTSHRGGTKPSQTRIPLPHFASLKTKDIKAELSKHGLSSNGTTSMQTRRLSKYITLFNANLDANPLHQKSLESLREELEQWESLQESENLRLDKNREKIFSNQARYLKANHHQFASLIQQASKSLQSTQKLVAPHVSDSVLEPTTTDGRDPAPDASTSKLVPSELDHTSEVAPSTDHTSEVTPSTTRVSSPKIGERQSSHPPLTQLKPATGNENHPDLNPSTSGAVRDHSDNQATDHLGEPASHLVPLKASNPPPLESAASDPPPLESAARDVNHLQADTSTSNTLSADSDTTIAVT